jgi:ADP-ribose pyrophosphatase
VVVTRRDTEVHTRIIIADGLTNEFLSPEVQFRHRPVNVGTHEIARLMGSGTEFGTGPLPTYLNQFLASRNPRADAALLVFRDLDDEASADGFDAGSADFVEPFHDCVKRAQVIPCARGEIPFESFCGAIEQLTGVERVSKPKGSHKIRFLLVGCHTDKRIFIAATFLRDVLGFKNVAVCSHLVGSPIREAHLASLVHGFPSSDVRVFLDLGQAAKFVGFDSSAFSAFDCHPCRITPTEARRALGAERRNIIEFLCMHWTKAELKPLQGGYTGSLLFLANGWKGPSRTEPMVLKVDRYSQMRREIEGYQEVKDLFGKNVPTFTYPVTLGESTGVGMELAAMEGRPETLQDSFETADGDESTSRFMRRLGKALDLAVEKLYRNTRTSSWVVPYRRFELHTQQQLDWLRENVGYVVEYAEQAKASEMPMPVEGIENMLRLIAANEDGIDSEVCLAHGDLNLKNVICDEGDNIWFIDWTHSDQYPVEMDFAKVENDVKFVMSKQFEVDDLPRLRRFEEYLLANREPAEANRLPKALAFAKWDLRFRKILDAVRRIRQACFSLKKEKDDWLAYRVALLKYALHTLSFDERRELGECGVIQLLHALFSVEGLVFILVADDFNLKTRGQKPSSYPPRFRVLIDEAPWSIACPSYQPPYYVDAAVLQNDSAKDPLAWADPEDFSKVTATKLLREDAHRDDEGRPLNPRGRTGIAGRGLLGLWGANQMVGAVVTRINRETAALEVLLGKIRETDAVSLPSDFVSRGETAHVARLRTLETSAGFRPKNTGEIISEGYSYDARQTDHAWIELETRLYHLEAEFQPTTFRPGAGFEEIEWWPVEPETVNQLPSTQARLVREAVRRLLDQKIVERDWALQTLANTG